MKITNIGFSRVLVKVDRSKSQQLIDQVGFELDKIGKGSKNLIDADLQMTTGIVVMSASKSDTFKVGDRVLFPKHEGIIVTEYIKTEKEEVSNSLIQLIDGKDKKVIYRIISDTMIFGVVELQKEELEDIVND